MQPKNWLLMWTKRLCSILGRLQVYDRFTLQVMLKKKIIINYQNVPDFIICACKYTVIYNRMMMASSGCDWMVNGSRWNSCECFIWQYERCLCMSTVGTVCLRANTKILLTLNTSTMLCIPTTYSCCSEFTFFKYFMSLHVCGLEHHVLWMH